MLFRYHTKNWHTWHEIESEFWAFWLAKKPNFVVERIA
jgi:hypothetical protein